MKVLTVLSIISWCGLSLALSGVHDVDKVPAVEISTAPARTIPFWGKVKGDHVNIRSGASLNYEVLTQLNDGDAVAVLMESAGWYQIVPPPGAAYWIFHQYVQDGKVTADAVNVRSGPGTGNSIACQLNKGDAVETIETRGDWLRIVPPQGASAWIHRDYVAYDRPYEGPPSAQLQAGSGVEASRKAKLIWEAEQAEHSEFMKPVNEIEIKSLIRGYEAILAEFPGDEAMNSRIRDRIAELKQKETFLTGSRPDAAGAAAKKAPPPVAVIEITPDQGPARGVPEPSSETAAGGAQQPAAGTPAVGVVQESPGIGKTEALLAPGEESASPPQSRLEIFKGRLETSGFGKFKKFKLIKDRRRICILSEGSVSLEKYIHRDVTIRGTTIDWIYPRIPVVRVEEIEIHGGRGNM